MPMEQTLLNESNKSKPIEIWIKLWGIALILAGLSTLLVKNGLENVIIISGYGAALVWGKRIYAIRILGLIFSAMWVVGTLVWTHYHTTVKPDFFQQIYFLISSLFYLGLFTFLLMPDVKDAFGPSPVAAVASPVLTIDEERRIKLWIRIVAIALISEALVGYFFFSWFRSHGLPSEGRVGTLLGVLGGLGLFTLRQNIGRRFALFV